MESIISEKPEKIIRNKKKLENDLDVKITKKSGEIYIEGAPEDEYFARQVIEAINFGFPISISIMIKTENLTFDRINIKEHTKSKNLERIRARLIGKNGRTLKTLTELTDCHFEIKDNDVGIIGDPERIKNAHDAVVHLITGAKQANVYAYLEKHQPKPLLDLGLKREKDKKSNRLK